MTRSQVMSRVRSSGTRLESRFKTLARLAGARLRRADELLGKPDFRILGTRTLIFVNSCFWHGCPWHCRLPGSRKEYWIPKIERNIQRQRKVVRSLRRNGYQVLVVWEHRMARTPEIVIQQLRQVKLRKLR